VTTARGAGAALADGAYAVIAAALLALAGWAAVATLRADAGVPSDEAWRRAAALVRAQVRPGDLVTFAPPWIDPVGRLHLGDLLSVAAAARADADGFARVWVLAIRGATADEVAGERPALTRTFDGVDVRRYDRAPAQVHDDAARLLATARVRGAARRGPTLLIAEVGFTPRRCVQVVPPPGGAVEIVFPRFALGRALVGHVGLADVFTRRDVREPGELEVRVAGQTVVRQRVGVDDGWLRFTAPTTPGLAEVTVVARAPSPRARDRLLCFTLESRR
jgi:hypothetical protein